MTRYASMIHGNVKKAGNSHPAASLTTDDATVLALNTTTQELTFNSANLDFMAANPTVNSGAGLTDYAVWHTGAVAKRMLMSDLKTLLGVVAYSAGDGIDVTGSVISLDISSLTSSLTPASGDYIPIQDVSAGNDKRVPISYIADLALYNAVELQSRAVAATAPSTNQALTWNGSAWAPATLDFMAADPAINSGADLSDYVVWHNGTVGKRMLLSDLQTLINTDTDTTYSAGSGINITGTVISADISYLQSTLSFLTNHLWSQDTTYGIHYSSSVGIGRNSESAYDLVVDGASKFYNSLIAYAIASDTFLILGEVIGAGTPDSGYGVLYVKTDGKLYFKNDAGTETALT